MKIAFYAPMKSPDHPVPSGDRLMARLLMAALVQAGHEVELISDLRVFMRDPHDIASAIALYEAANSEIARISHRWEQSGVPDLWFCYHPYYKSPDLQGPWLCESFGVAYVTAESSWSRRRNDGEWAKNQQRVLDGARLAAVNICLTQRDRMGLADAAPEATLAMLPPFIEAGVFLEIVPEPQPFSLVTVAMMRAGDKFESYRVLALALSRIPTDIPWQLSVVGDGPCRKDVEALFAGFAPGKITWHGEKSRNKIAEIFSKSSVYVWPGNGEAYGLAYLEAQAAGLPVIAQAVAGVPEVVIDGQTGILTPPGDADAFAGAISTLLRDDNERRRLGKQARRFVRDERSPEAASVRLADLLKTYVKACL